MNRRRRSRAGWAALLVAGGALISLGFIAGNPPDAPLPSSPFAISAAAVDSPDTAAAQPVPALPPDRLVIESLGIDAPLAPKPLASSGDLVVPGDVRVVGLWSTGPGLSARAGTTVLAGHVDRDGNLGALHPLHRIQPGARVAVSDSVGRTTHWRVVSLRAVSKDRLPHFGKSGERRLAIVTCGGAVIDTPAGRGYADNVIATAVPQPEPRHDPDP